MLHKPLNGASRFALMAGEPLQLLGSPLGAQLASFGSRFVLWRLETNREGRQVKMPYQDNGRIKAASNNPATWAPLDTILRVLPERQVDGFGIMFGRLEDGRWTVGIDLDLCRSPVTGEIMAWAQTIIDRMPTYAEVSPSGTGVKIFGLISEMPQAMWDPHDKKYKGKKMVPSG